jgi:hypothetical protein
MENSLDTDEVYSYLKLSIKPPGPQDEDTLENVTGSFRWWHKDGAFGALVRNEKETANYWDIDEVEWAEIPEDDDNPLMFECDPDDTIETC